jgi:hypothetical protein
MKSLLALTFIFIAVVGCGGTSSPDAAAGDELLGAAAAYRFFDDNPCGQDVFERVEVVEVLGHWNGNDVRIKFDDGSPRLTSAQREVIVESLAPKEVEFVPDSQNRTDAGRLSLTAPEGSNKDATVATELAYGNGCAAGGTQNFVADDAGWRYTENVGVQWIS